MRHLSAFVLIVLLAIMPSCKYFGGKGSAKKKAEAAMLARQDSIRVADSIRKVQDAMMAEENAKLEAAKKADEEKAAMDAKFKYNIIVGSFVTPEYATKLSEVYKKQGYDPKIIKVEGSKFELVAAEAHDSFRKAVTRLKEFQDTIQVDSWMYIKK
jgi:hypothetical protein